MQALLSNNQELRFTRNENTAVHNRFSYSFDISRRAGSSIPRWLLHLGADIIHSPNTAFSPAPGASSSNKNEDNWPPRLLSCLSRILELASWRPAWPWTFHWQFQEQIKNFPFFSSLKFVFFLNLVLLSSTLPTFIIFFILFCLISSMFCRARQRDFLLAGTFEMSWLIDWQSPPYKY